MGQPWGSESRHVLKHPLHPKVPTAQHGHGDHPHPEVAVRRLRELGRPSGATALPRALFDPLSAMLPASNIVK